MAIIFIDGFDHYVTADIGKKWDVIGSGNTIVSSVGRRGSSGLRGSAFASTWLRKYFEAVDTVIVGFSIKQDTAIAASGWKPLQFREADIYHVCIGVDSSGYLQAMRGTSTVLGTATTIPLAADTEYYIEVKAKIHASAGTVHIRVNGTEVLALTGANTKNGGAGVCNGISFVPGLTTNSSAPAYIDDVYIADTSGSVNNDFLGDSIVEVLTATADGTYTDFTPSTGTDHYALVDDTAPNTTDYNSSSTGDARDSYIMADLPARVDTVVHAVQTVAAATKSAAGAANLVPFVRVGTTNGEALSKDTATAQKFLRGIIESNPLGPAAWAESSVNTAQVGVRYNSPTPTSTKWRLWMTANGGSTITALCEIVLRPGSGQAMPAGTATASSEWDATTYAASKAVDGDSGTRWQTTTSYGYPAWWQFEFSTPQAITHYTLIGYSDATRAPTDWILQYYDGTQWVDFHRCDGVSWAASETKEYDTTISSAAQLSQIVLEVLRPNAAEGSGATAARPVVFFST